MFEKILTTVKGRLEILQEAIDRGLYDPIVSILLKKEQNNFRHKFEVFLMMEEKHVMMNLVKKRGYLIEEK